MLFLLIGLHVVCATVVFLVGSRLGRWVWPIAATAPTAVVVWLLVNAGAMSDGGAISQKSEWVPGMGLGLDLRVDAFSTLMLILVSGIGALIFAYAWHYFGNSPSSPRAAGLLTLFAASMVGIVIADNLLALYVFWELTSVTSYLLIGLDDTEAEARSAAQQAWLVTSLGGLAMLAGFVLLGQQAGTYTISEILTAPPSGTTTAVALMLILVGAFTKSAQYPFHSWLPTAMVAPTPISAYLHSAAMVKAGVYLVARLAPAFAVVGPWRPVVVTVGLVTMIAGGLRALRPFDLKQLLAFGTISQLGFLMVLFGIGQPAATAAGCALLLAHGLFKAALFMVVGIVDHKAGTRDIRELPDLGRGWGPTKAVALLSAASMAGVPLLAGFISKEQAYGALVDRSGFDRLVLVGIVIGSMLTVAYSLRFVAALVLPDLVSPELTDRPPARRSPTFWFASTGVLLATGSVVLGVAPRVWSGLVDAAAHALDPGAHAHLVLWHGLTTPLVLSVITLGVGAALFVLRRPVASAQARLTFPVSGLQGYDAVLRSTLGFAGRLTRIVQSGSLPIYAAVIFSAVVIAPMVAMVTGRWWPGWPMLIGTPAHLPIAVVLVVGAVAATLIGRRFAAAILLGVVGYAMGMLFVLQGAPDLALTQFAVETLSVVVFLLVLRVLPDRFELRSTTIRRPLRIAISAAVGVFVVLMAIASSGARTEPSVSGEMAEQALPRGGGRNIVNVILVDIRGMDTLGEISVLVTAGIGVVAIARVGRRRPADPVHPRRRRRTENVDAP